ncbi:16S rRNA (cytosine(1402)-N(4))-methyltransferase RsmH [Candidatus Bipolaricaulota bacterium]|nr:16S rRNA (cytosine(1402)-N(4))-methyltransferase RsmH [Candidatus Bipolaricaulota bacterium]MBS3791346.1 16S rRNA (cytosine(1402)-N(4))-methyltransferase RsmH [Candidatus Bipolaricaulota bacterium]
MVDEVLNYLVPEKSKGGVFVDATASTGGHAIELARRLGPEGTLIGLDLDETGLKVAKDRLSGTPPQVKLYQANYKDMNLALEAAGEPGADGLLFDLGFSSFQIDEPSRGFSFQNDGPLDMRMDPGGEITAEKIVNEYSFKELKRIITRYGEESWADGIARKIVERRKKERITTTGELAEVIEASIPEGERARRNQHPATRTFQALRIAVNDELANIDQGLETGFDCLNKGGVMVVISYHSLEDRKVKRFFAYREKECICPPDLPVCRCEKDTEVDILTEGAVRPSEEEIEKNPRARSAKLRAARKLVNRAK